MILIPPMEEFFSQFASPVKDVAGDVKSMGKLLYTKYVFPFEIASVLILAAMVGAVMLGKKSYSNEEK
jgi:NADH-quinone oxidoreductase subunit J